MTKKQLLRNLKRLKALEGRGWTERIHLIADELLIKYIKDQEIADVYNKLDKWYS